MKVLHQSTIRDGNIASHFTIEADQHRLYITTCIEHQGQPGCHVAVELPRTIVEQLRKALNEIAAQPFEVEYD